MKFRLIFEGELPPRPRATLKAIHDIRLYFAPQMKTLWDFPPLAKETSDWLKFPADKKGDYAILERRGDVVFAPLISKRNDLQCELKITFLRRQAPGQLIGDGGDIDNRLKTLLDALSVPPKAQADFFTLQKGPPKNEQAAAPVFCLLQDDALVIDLAVETDRLLRSTRNARELIAIIQVNVRAARVTYGTLGLMG